MKKFYDVGITKFRKGSWGFGISWYHDKGFQVVAFADEDDNLIEADEPFIESERRFYIDLFKWSISFTRTVERG